MNTIASRGAKHAKLAAHTWGHRPNASLHDQFGNIPNRLNFDDLALGNPIILVEPHVGQTLRRGDVQKRRGKRPNIVASAADPIGAMIIGPRHHDPIATFNIRHRGRQRRKNGVEICGPRHVAKRRAHMHHRIIRQHINQRIVHASAVIHRRP